MGQDPIDTLQDSRTIQREKEKIQCRSELGWQQPTKNSEGLGEHRFPQAHGTKHYWKP